MLQKQRSFTLRSKEFLFLPYLLGGLYKTKQNSECHTILYTSNSNKFEPVWARASPEQVWTCLDRRVNQNFSRLAFSLTRTTFKVGPIETCAMKAKKLHSKKQGVLFWPYHLGGLYNATHVYTCLIQTRLNQSELEPVHNRTSLNLFKQWSLCTLRRSLAFLDISWLYWLSIDTTF